MSHCDIILIFLDYYDRQKFRMVVVNLWNVFFKLTLISIPKGVDNLRRFCFLPFRSFGLGVRRGSDRMVVGFTTTCAISAYHH
jgi:hypothetical protein